MKDIFRRLVEDEASNWAMIAPLESGRQKGLQIKIAVEIQGSSARSDKERFVQRRLFVC